MTTTPRQRFLQYVRDPLTHRPIVSPFLPYADVVERTLRHLSLPVGDDPIANEIALSRALDYEPMFMTDIGGLIFPWQIDESRSDTDYRLMTLQTPLGEWTRRVSRNLGEWGDESGFPVKEEADHAMLVAVCEQVETRRESIREYFRQWRVRIGEDGVIVLGHPHPTWLSFQISQQNIIMHWLDYPETFRHSVDAIFQASLVVNEIGLQEGIDFMSDGAYGLEMINMKFCREVDAPVLRAYADWTHARGGLFWYHNCGLARTMIREGIFNEMDADVIETVAPPPSGDNELAESRRWLDRRVCTKGNLDLGLLRDGTPAQVREATLRMADAVRGYAHIFSTADAVLPNTPAENYITFVQAAREGSGR